MNSLYKASLNKGIFSERIFESFYIPYSKYVIADWIPGIARGFLILNLLVIYWQSVQYIPQYQREQRVNSWHFPLVVFVFRCTIS